MRSPWHSEPLTELPAAEQAAICDRVSAQTRARRRAGETYDQKVERLARDIEHVHARQESVQDEDLLTLGWSIPALAELLPDAMNRVRDRSARHVN